MKFFRYPQDGQPCAQCDVGENNQKYYFGLLANCKKQFGTEVSKADPREGLPLQLIHRYQNPGTFNVVLTGKIYYIALVIWFYGTKLSSSLLLCIERKYCK